MNNQRLERTILGYVAKFAERYSVKLYALSIEGNHIQGPARLLSRAGPEAIEPLRAAVQHEFVGLGTVLATQTLLELELSAERPGKNS